jgi:putative membrane protein
MELVRSGRFAFALGLALVAGACSKTQDTGDQALQDTAAAPAPAAAPAGPSDAEIAHIVVTANTIDIDAGQLAKGTSKNSQVTEFAQRMITDHTGVNDQASQLAQRLNLTPADNATSQSLKTSADQNLQNLRNLKGAEFDRAYMSNVKALLEQTRPAIAAHLDMARKIQSALPQ